MNPVHTSRKHLILPSEAMAALTRIQSRSEVFGTYHCASLLSRLVRRFSIEKRILLSPLCETVLPSVFVQLERIYAI